MYLLLTSPPACCSVALIATVTEYVPVAASVNSPELLLATFVLARMVVSQGTVNSAVLELCDIASSPPLESIPNIVSASVPSDPFDPFEPFEPAAPAIAFVSVCVSV